MKKQPKYVVLQHYLQEHIQRGQFKIDDYLPSEHELCKQFGITRTTVRKALDELVKEGFIEREQGKGSRVKERRQSLGLLSVKGFSEVVGQNVRTFFLQKPQRGSWSNDIQYPLSEKEFEQPCIHFERLRCVGETPVMLENNWFVANELQNFLEQPFVDGSFFKTLSQIYLVEIKGAEQELRAKQAGKKLAHLLNMQSGDPILHISIRFKTSNPNLTIYSELFCNTIHFPIGNSYLH